MRNRLFPVSLFRLINQNLINSALQADDETTPGRLCTFLVRLLVKPPLERTALVASPAGHPGVLRAGSSEPGRRDCHLGGLFMFTRPLTDRPRCVACGAHRPRSHHWPRLCRPCWQWHRVLTGLSLAGPHLRQTGSSYPVTKDLTISPATNPHRHRIISYPPRRVSPDPVTID